MKIKLLILKNEISSYNTPIYNILGEKYDLTVGFYLKDKSSIGKKFKTIKLDYVKIGSFIYINDLFGIINEFDVVSIISDLHVISYIILPFIKCKCKIITWGIGFRCSYTHPYVVERKHTVVDYLDEIILRRSDANIFYMEKAKEFWSDSNLDKSKIFIAPNTTEVIDIKIDDSKKKNILFVGTLYKGKGIDILINAFEKAVKDIETGTKLVIIGDGGMRSELEMYVNKNKLKGKVVFTGAIYDENELSKYFQEAILCVSPTQGGLTCPKSMGYGVPFVCRYDAITGGEIYHMTPGVNGIMYNTFQELSDILLDAMQNPRRYIEMGHKAQTYYRENATLQHMAAGVIQAVEYVLSC